jgi:hypothetical protein
MSKEEANKIQGILKGLGDEISLGHCYELIARMSDHTSWKDASSTTKTIEQEPSKIIPVNLSKVDLSDLNGRAEWMLLFFRAGQRDTKETYYYLEDHPKKPIAQEIVRACHGDMMPDNYKYSFIRECLLQIREVTDGNYDDIDVEADVYTADLLRWLSSNLTRTGYMDQAATDYGPFEQFEHHLMAGQSLEKKEILDTLLHILSKESTYQDMKD